MRLFDTTATPTITEVIELYPRDAYSLTWKTVPAKDLYLVCLGENAYKFCISTVSLDEMRSQNIAPDDADIEQFWLINPAQTKEENMEFLLSAIGRNQLLTLEQVKDIFNFDPQLWIADRFDAALNICNYLPEQLIALTSSPYLDRQLLAISALKPKVWDNPELKDRLREASLIKKLVALLKTENQTHLMLITAMLGDLISNNTANQNAVREENAIPLLLSLLQTQNDLVKINIVQVLGWWIKNNSENQNLLHKENGVDALLGLGAATQNQDLRRVVSRTLEIFKSSNTENQKIVDALLQQPPYRFLRWPVLKVSAHSAFKPVQKRATPPTYESYNAAENESMQNTDTSTAKRPVPTDEDSAAPAKRQRVMP